MGLEERFQLQQPIARNAVGELKRALGLEAWEKVCGPELAGQAYLALAFDTLGVHVSDDERTPWRVAKWLSSYAGRPNHSTSLPEDITRAIQEDTHDEMVLVKGIEFTALCEHHFLPFSGRAAVGYIPQGQMIGLSKLARVVHHYTNQPTLQEHITTHIADALEANLKPLGVMVVLYDVAHSCMSSRGIKEHDATTTTSAVRGVFRTVPEARLEFTSLLAR